MIFKEQAPDLQVIGENTQYRTSIKEQDIDFVVTILSSNLYSNPESSFIREIVSNGWDSQVEAGTTDKPIIIKFDKKDHTITIRDYGTGLSPERVKEVYCNIGSSTKRESNNFIGGFGIGHYSALSCSNIVHIRSFYNGMEYYYLLCKDGSSITTTLVMTSFTEEPNGVAISINTTNFDKYYDALPSVAFFPNVYVDSDRTYDSDVQLINSVKKKVFKYFAVCDSHLDDKILIGNVLYPLREKCKLSKEAQDALENIHNSIVIYFNIGELNITPNREEIIYNQSTIDLISERVLQAAKELDDLALQVIPQDFNDLWEYSQWRAHNSHYYNPLTNKVGNIYNYYKVDHLLNNTYKGKDWNKYKYRIEVVLTSAPPNLKACTCRGDFHFHNSISYSYHSAQLRTSTIIKVPNRLTANIRAYIASKYTDAAIVTEYTKEYFIDQVSQRFIDYDSSLEEREIIHAIAEELYNYAEAKSVIIDTNSKEYEDFRLANSTVTEKSNESCILRVYKNSWVDRNDFNLFAEAVLFVKKLKRGVIIANTKEEVNETIIKLCHFTLIKTSNPIKKRFLSLGLDNIKEYSWLIRHYKKLIKYKSISIAFKEANYPRVSEMGFFLYTIPNSLQEEFKDIYDSLKCINTCLTDLTNTPILTDESITKRASLFFDYYNKFQKAETIRVATGLQGDAVTIAALVKLKLYRVSKEAYKDYRNNIFTKLLKNEYYHH